MTQTQPYRVERDFILDARHHRRGERIELTDRQARHLRLAGFVSPVEVAPVKPPSRPKRFTGKTKAKVKEKT